jgi:hypothetical protein
MRTGFCLGTLLIVLGLGQLLSIHAVADPLKLDKKHEFHFVRGIYTSATDMLETRAYGVPGWWAIDYPKADEQLMVAVSRLTNIDTFDSSQAMSLTDPELRNYPFLYMLEMGRSAALTESEVSALHDYLMAGGFLVIDDFWGTAQWNRFESQIKRVLPGRPIVELDHSHPVFNIFYDIPEILQVPNVRQGQWSVYGGPTYEFDGYQPQVRGIFDDEGRLMVLINWNTDLGDGWEWADDPYYPLRFSTYAFQVAVNFIIYGMTY